MVTVGQKESPTTRAKGIKDFRPGVLSGQNNKGPAVTNMRYYLENGKVLTRDKRLFMEMSHFAKQKSGSWAAQAGFHDDLVMSFVWTLYTLHKNIVEKYFIVTAKHSNGFPKYIENKFTYEIDTKEENEAITEEFRDYSNLPVVVFGRVGANHIVDPIGTDKEKKKKEEIGWDLFSVGNWTPL